MSGGRFTSVLGVPHGERRAWRASAAGLGSGDRPARRALSTVGGESSFANRGLRVPYQRGLLRADPRDGSRVPDRRGVLPVDSRGAGCAACGRAFPSSSRTNGPRTPSGTPAEAPHRIPRGVSRAVDAIACNGTPLPRLLRHGRSDSPANGSSSARWLPTPGLHGVGSRRSRPPAVRGLAASPVSLRGRLVVPEGGSRADRGAGRGRRRPAGPGIARLRRRGPGARPSRVAGARRSAWDRQLRRRTWTTPGRAGVLRRRATRS